METDLLESLRPQREKAVRPRLVAIARPQRGHDRCAKEKQDSAKLGMIEMIDEWEFISDQCR